MISLLKRVIALLSGTKAEPTEAIAQPMPIAGPANQEPTTQLGNKPSALTTAPVQTEQKSKRSRARQTTVEASPKQERTSAKRTAIQPGQQQVTHAPQTRQPAKRGRKPKQ